MKTDDLHIGFNKEHTSFSYCSDLTVYTEQFRSGMLVPAGWNAAVPAFS